MIACNINSLRQRIPKERKKQTKSEFIVFMVFAAFLGFRGFRYMLRFCNRVIESNFLGLVLLSYISKELLKVS